jgi:hypothetical protein
MTFDGFAASTWRVGLALMLLFPLGALANLLGLPPPRSYSAFEWTLAAVLSGLLLSCAFLHSFGYRKLSRPRPWQDGWGLPALTVMLFVAAYQLP